MTSLAPPQLTLSFEPSLPERFVTLRAYVAHRANMQTKPMKVIAADLDMSPSTLSRKLNPRDEDTQRFNCDDLEGYIKSTGDASAVIEYLAAKYMDSDAARKSRVLANVERLSLEMNAALSALREIAP